MKLLIFVLTLSGIFVSCSNTNGNKSFTDTSSIEAQSGFSNSASQRDLLIQELKKFKAAFASNNKEIITQLFSFPLSDTAFVIYADDSTYLNEFKKNGNKTTKTMFLKYFQQVYRSMQFDQINELFKRLDIDSLKEKDSLQNEVRSTNEPCYKFYHIYLEKDIVTFEFGTNTNENYVDDTIKTEDDEGSGDECEFASIWIFKFDGQKLYFVKQITAG